jgi:hypothetical protein
MILDTVKLVRWLVSKIKKKRVNIRISIEVK